METYEVFKLLKSFTFHGETSFNLCFENILQQKVFLKLRAMGRTKLKKYAEIF